MNTLGGSSLEADYRSFFEQALEGLFLSKPGGQWLDVNPALVEMVGYAEREDVLALDTRNDLFVDRAAYESLIEQVRGGAQVKGFETKLNPRDGTPIIVQISARGRFGDGDTFIGFEGVVHNITAQRQAEQALQRSEARYQSLLNDLPVGVYRTTPDGDILEANPAMAALLGADDVEVLRQHRVSDFFVNEADRSEHLGKLNDEATRTSEFPLRRLDGDIVWVNDHARAVRNDRDEVIYYDGAMLDITEQRRAQEALRRSEERYRSLLERTPVAIVVHSEGEILYVNPAAVAMRNAEQAQHLIGEPVLGLVHPDDRARAQKRLGHTYAREHIQNPWDVRLLRADGSSVMAEVTTIPIMYRGKAAAQVVIRDVTQRKAFEQSLVDAKERAEEMARLKSALLANMSHEIRTPLTAIIGFAEILREELDDVHSEWSSLIEQSGNRLKNTLNSVLDFAQLEADGLQLNLAPVDVAAQLRTSVPLFERQAGTKDLAFEADIPEHPVHALVEEACLDRVVNNLISNAIKFTSEGTVRLTVATEDDAVVVRVTDTGVGIAPEFIPDLFEEFKQESTGQRRTHEGSGLGLAITKRLVQAMSGTVRVESEKGEGSRFTLRFERAQAPTE